MKPSLLLLASLLSLSSIPARADAQTAPPTVAPTTPAPPPPARITQAQAEAAIAKVNAWFNSATTMESNFTQVSPAGRRSTGQLYVQRPGRLHFQYDPPSALQIIADGKTVAVRDSKLGTQDEYFISQTPLKFLVKNPIDLARDTRVLEVGITQTEVSILVEDRTTFGGTSRISLIFDPVSYALKEWTVTDPQGYKTRVSLSNIDLHATPDPQLFKIPPRSRD